MLGWAPHSAQALLLAVAQGHTAQAAREAEALTLSQCAWQAEEASAKKRFSMSIFTLCSVPTLQTGSRCWDPTWDGVQPSRAPVGAVPWLYGAMPSTAQTLHSELVKENGMGYRNNFVDPLSEVQ